MAAAAEVVDAAANQADGPEAPWSYRNILALAPMVRVNTLPFRLLAREYGANIVYSEELVDRSVVQCRRSENAALGTIDFRHESGKLIFSTVPHERVAFQLGTASAGDALRAAQVVCADVRAIDINMGCPVKFSVQGGMGAALLSKPERVKDILGTLVRNLPGVPVTCKIRLLDSAHDTLQLARAIQETGVAALAVHGRRRNDRPRWWAQWDQVALLRQQLGSELPLLPNGDIFLPEHVRGAREATGCDSLMLARGAMWNASLFGAPEAELRPQREVVARYVALCRRYDAYFGNAKYVIMNMLEGHGKTETYKQVQKATDLGGLERAAAAMQADPGFAQPYRVPMALEPAPDLLREAIPPHVRVQLQKQAVQPPAKRPFAQLSEASPGQPEPEEREVERAPLHAAEAETEGEAENSAPVATEL